MTLMGLEIGGAETHVLELCKALRKEGVEVYVASNGGAYETELRQWGVRHFMVPLHNKHLGNLVSAYKHLRHIIIEHDIKLVHAHARIPAFLCGLLSRKLNIRFVTTAHGTFTTTFPFNILTNWGERTLAVSKDVGQYLVNNYSIPKERITLTINGIDTDKFNPEAPYSNLIEEFQLDSEATRIVFVSRLDRYKAAVAYKLIEAVPAILKKHPRTEFVIIGDGESFAKVKEVAKAANTRLGRPVVTICGARIDINSFVSSADIFVGVSRCALEAMAAARPVVLAGEEGYLGILDDGAVGKGMETNFTCRGCTQTTAAAIAEDISRIIEMPPEGRDSLGALGRRLVLEHYSTAKMATDALALYNAVRAPKKRPFDILISGYYGFGNNGDDAVLQAIVDSLKKERPNLRVVVLSKNPQDTEVRYGVTSIFRFNFPKVRRYLKNTHLLITGGGTLLQDLTSTQSLIYYLWVINTAHKSGARTMLYANGIGPLRYESNKARVAAALRHIDAITLRDNGSLEELGRFNNLRCSIAVTADAAFALNLPSPQRQAETLSALGILPGGYFVIAVRSWKYIARGFEDELSAFIEQAAVAHSLTPVFIAMQPDNDAEISRRIAARLRNVQPIVLDQPLPTEEYLSIVGGSAFTTAMRLHAIIYGAKTATPCIGLVYDPKVRAMMQAMGQDTFISVEDTNHAILLGFTQRIMKRRNEISAEIQASIAPLAARAQGNATHALELLERPLF